MTDYFALLNEPRRPWLDPDSLKKKFLALAAGIHPDRIHNADELEKAEANRRYAELNAAYQLPGRAEIAAAAPARTGTRRETERRSTNPRRPR